MAIDPQRNRRPSRPVGVGNLTIGGNAPIVVQSMTNTDTHDVEATVEQILRLETAGCEMVRVALPDREAALALGAIRSRIHIPLVADIHFDYRLALEALEQGVDKLRLNPGNLRHKDGVKQVARAAAKREVPIRIGVNAGSLPRELLKRHGGQPSAAAMVESALEEITRLEQAGFDRIVISLKASHLPLTVEANRILAKKTSYPFHLGITEAGTAWGGAIRSAAGLGILLGEGIGDTIRVSLNADPEEEIRAAYVILNALELRRRGPVLIACPTCGRMEIDLVTLAGQVERELDQITAPIKVAVMGCAVNGPGEARGADVGVAGGRGVGIIFRRGQVVAKVPEDRILETLMNEIRELVRLDGSSA